MPRLSHASASSLPSSSKGRSTSLPSILQPFISLFTSQFLQNRSQRCQHTRSWCVRTSRRDGDRFRNRHVHNFVVLRDVYFFVFQMFDLTLWARKTTTYTTAPRTEDRFRNPTPCPFLLLTWQLSFGHPLIVVESSFTDPVHA